MQRHDEGRVTDLPISNTGAKSGEWSMPRPSQLTPTNNPDNHYTGSCVGPGPNMENMEISFLHWGLKLGPSSPWTVDIPNMLCGPVDIVVYFMMTSVSQNIQLSMLG